MTTRRYRALIISLLLCITLMMLLVTGCTAEGESRQENPQPVSKINTISNSSIYVFVDPDTGVNYIVYAGYEKGGITPRYNPDGTIMVTETTE